ncbi:MAG: hypothetical protein NWS20_01535, partial [Rickettsiaceae bacterium]|nr:hypothetical protein [Rickettsiaceae bacterium]
GHGFPVSIISHVVWLHHRFNHSYRDIQEQMAYRGIILSHETIRSWCYKFASHFKEVIKKQEHRPKDKWYLDGTEGWQSQMTIRINGEYFVLWRAVALMVMSWMFLYRNVKTRKLLYVF